MRSFMRLISFLQDPLMLYYYIWPLTPNYTIPNFKTQPVSLIGGVSDLWPRGHGFDECRTIALPDNYPPGRLPPGQLPSWTIALQDNCPPGQLPSPYINIYYLDGYATAIVISLWMLLLLGYATIILALSEMWVPVLLNVSTGVSRTWWHLDWGHVITDRLSINV